MLYDCYSCLLTEKKRSVLELYYEEDLSLSEIAEQEGVTKAAVHDSIRSSEKKLEEYEAKLHLAEKKLRMDAALSELSEIIRGEAEGGRAEELEKLRRKIEEIYGL